MVVAQLYDEHNEVELCLSVCTCAHEQFVGKQSSSVTKMNAEYPSHKRMSGIVVDAADAWQSGARTGSGTNG